MPLALSLTCACLCLAAPEPLVLSAGDQPAAWSAGTLDREHPHGTTPALAWQHGRDPQLSLKRVPADWSAYDHLSFRLWSAHATGSRFTLIVYSENPASEGPDYWSAPFTLDYTGWRQFRVYLPTMAPSRAPLGWDKVTGLMFTASGWGNTPDPAAVCALADLRLEVLGKEVGPKLSEDGLFELLDLARPELAAVAQAERAGDRATARHLLAEHFRRRTRPKYYDSASNWPDPPPVKPDTSRADRAVRHKLQSIGLMHQFGPTIDWHYDLTAAPDSPSPPNNEWTWQLNRHEDWLALAAAYRNTRDEQYANAFVEQLLGWCRDCPLPDGWGNDPRSAWRTIETGIRGGQHWPVFWYRFLHSPALTDDALLIFARAFIDHGRHLAHYHTGGNWLAMEGNGLYHVATLFPELRDAAKWRETAAGWIYQELDNQVYPDGVQIELASGYHHVSLSNFLGLFRLARLNDQPLPADFLKRLQKMYDYDVYVAMPDWRVPGTQDGGYFDIRGELRTAAELFPERADFQWYASGGQTGTPPAETSHAFPYAGYYIMRTGWQRDANWLLFDGGPFGYGHQHEDKLELIVSAYGKLLLVDPGVYTYERSKWRDYFIDSFSHNVVLVDGQPQRRRLQPRSTYVVKQPLPHVWQSDARSDYVEATFDEGFAKPVGQGVSHTRAVLFIKDPGLWVVCDRLAALDGREHDYDALFHFDAKVAADGLRVVTQETNSPNLTVAARPDPGLSLKLVEGQENPVQGWLTRGSHGVRPAPVGVFRRHGGTVTTIYALVPARTGEADPLVSVEGAGEQATVRLRSGRAFRVKFELGRPASWQVAEPGAASLR